MFPAFKLIRIPCGPCEGEGGKSGGSATGLLGQWLF